MTRFIARIRIGVCLVVGLSALPVAAADSAPTASSAKAAPMLAQAAIPTTEPPPASAEAAPSPTAAPATPSTATPSTAPPSSAAPAAVPPGTAESVPPPTATAAAPVEAPQPVACGLLAPSCDGGPSLGWHVLHPFAACRANFAATHNAPTWFPRYDGTPRPDYVPGEHVAAFVQAPHPILASIVPGLGSSAEPGSEVDGQPVPQEGDPVHDGAAEPFAAGAQWSKRQGNKDAAPQERRDGSAAPITSSSARIRHTTPPSRSAPTARAARRSRM